MQHLFQASLLNLVQLIQLYRFLNNVTFVGKYLIMHIRIV